MDSGYSFCIKNFEGPLDLLFQLIEKNQIDIYDIPIAEITEQFIYYLDISSNISLDSLSEFLILASELLRIKAKMLLPKEKDEPEEEYEDDPRATLVERLLEYKRYKDASLLLAQKYEEMKMIFFRENEENQLYRNFGEGNPVENLSIIDVFNSFNYLLERNSIEKISPVVDISQEIINIEDCVKVILSELNKKPDGLLFEDFFAQRKSKSSVIAYFLGMLELFKAKKLFFSQDRAYNRIYIYRGKEE